MEGLLFGWGFIGLRVGFVEFDGGSSVWMGFYRA